MKIRKLQLKNIGVFDDETIEFQPCPVKDKAEIHILTGQNGSGKSTILMALASSFDYFEREGAFDAKYRTLSNDFLKRFKFNTNQVTGFTTSFDTPNNYEHFVLGDHQNHLAAPLPSSLQTTHYRHWNNTASGIIKDEDSSNFAVFAFSGHRNLSSERVEAIYEPKDFNPLDQSLEFIKRYDQREQLSINQLIANNISKSAIESSRNKAKSEKFAKVVESIERAIWEITNWEVKFDLQTEPTNLVITINNEELDFDVLPDGLRSLISWIADLLGRVDLLKWEDDLPIFEKNLIIFLDEIEVHLHPKWQRKVLPVVQKLFKNAQIFVSTHSPFVVNSVDDAWVYKLELENGKAKVASPIKSEDGYSYQTVLREIFDIDKRFGEEAQKELDGFYTQSKAILNANGNGKVSKEKFLAIANHLASQSAELQSLVFLELARLSKETGEPYQI